MEFLGARIQLNPRPLARRPAALEVGILGHCPGRVRIERFLALTELLNEIRQAGFAARLDRIFTLVTEVSIARATGVPQKDIEKLLDQLDAAVSHLPIPLHSIAEFDDIFPSARTTPTQYGSVLAGARAWLPQSVDDFFTNGGEKLWLVRIPEAEGVSGFLPEQPQSFLDVDKLSGLATLLVINRLGLVVMPDLERLQIPAQLPDIPRKRLANPEPAFLPLGSLLDDGHRERRHANELFDELPVQPLLTVLRSLLRLSSRERSDIQFIFTLPLSYSNNLASPAADIDALTLLNNARKTTNAHLLRQVQIVFPYLRQGDRIFSPVGMLAGAIAKNTMQNGAWRSVARQSLISLAQPFPSLDMQQTISLRETPGIGIINLKAGKLKLDDERLLVPALHRDDYLLPGESGDYSLRLSGMRSAEVVRFLGYLVRELRELGDHLIFNVDPQDLRPQLVLERFFLDLFRAGALRGNSPQDAFRITRTSSTENVIAFDIEIAPAYPIDKIVITFINRDGEWQAGVNRG